MSKFVSLCCLLVVSISGFAFNKIVFAPSATLTGGGTVCQNSTGPTLTFTGSGGVAPYTFTYTVNGGAQQTLTTTSGSSATLIAPTSTSGSFNYQLVSVSDSSTPVQTATVTGSVTVNVTPQPNGDINSDAVSGVFNGFPVFKICDNQPTLINFYNATTTPGLITGYTINWGDGSPVQSGTTWTTFSHTYAVGLWNLTYNLTSSNGCNLTKVYKVFVGNNPAVGLGNPGNTDICITSSLTFPITSTENNPPGTTYIVTFNDGSAPVTFNHPPPPNVTHTFLMTSCGVSSNIGNTIYQNSFYANIVAINPCDQSSATVVPIRISTPPVADFSLPTSNLCTNSSLCFTNTSTGGQTASNSNCTTPKIIWSVSPSTGYTISSGSLGDTFGNANTNAWTSGSSTLCLNFSIAGTYTITMTIGSRCGIDTEVKTICVGSPLTPQFTLNTTTGCAPLAVTATNSTNLANQCSPPTYLWQVTYTPAFCGTSVPNIPNQTTANATYNFTESGTYAIKLSVTNSCGTTFTTQTVTVKKPPTVSISPISNSCGTATINPVGTVTNCAPAGGTMTYAWSFPGGTPSSSTSLNPGSISYPTGGPYTVSFTATNECGTSTAATQSFTVNVEPVITNTVTNQTICSGSATTPVTLTANPSGTTFTWTATGTAGVTGFTTSGSGTTIPSQTLVTTNSNPGTVTYVVTPTFSNCVGPTFSYTVTVNPAPVISTQPVSSSVCLGGIVAPLTVSLNNTSVTPTYQWYSNTVNSTSGGTLLAGATNSSYTPPTSAVGTVYYYCLIGLTSNGCSSLTSAVASITVSPQPTITTQPLASQTVCEGATVSPFTVAYTGGLGAASYQWYVNTSPSTVGGTPIGTNSSSFTPSLFTTAGTYYYYVVISLSGSSCGMITSSVAEVIVVTDPIISSQPLTTQTQCQNTPATVLSVTASGGTGGYSYQWYSNSSNSTTGGVPLSGQTAATFTPPTTTIGTQYYYCVVSQSSVGCSVASNPASVTVVAAPTITTQPQSTTVCEGSSIAPLTVAYTNGTGTPLYQWFDANGAISGATSATYTPSSLLSGSYYCVLTFSSGGCTSITSATAVITINPLPTLAVQPLATQSICVGGTIPPLTVTYTGGVGTPTYQWYSSTTNTTTGGTPVGTNSASYTPPSFLATGTYYYYVTLSLTGAGCGVVTSTTAEVIVVPDPVVTTQPLASQTVCQNSPATVLSVQANGGLGATFSYQWYESTTNSTTSGLSLTGETNATFTPPTTTAGTFYYYCVVSQNSGNGCAVTSSVATVIVNLAPDFSAQPVSSSLCLGQTPQQLSFAVINGVGTPNYQWYSNTVNSTTGATPIGGATAATYVPPATSVGTMYYYCLVSFPSIIGGCSVITTSLAAVTINPVPVISSQNVTICSGNSFSVTPAASGSSIVPVGTTYTWSTPSFIPTGAILGAAAETSPQSMISQNLINTTTSPVDVVYTVTPISGTCVGANFTVTVTVNPAISPNEIVTNNVCFGVNTASITTNVTGGIPFTTGSPYQYNWTGPNGFSATSASINNLAPGNYQVTITDAGGCPFTASYTITEPNDLVITLDNELDVTCFNAANGSILLSINGGTGSYIFNWTRNGSFYSTNEDLVNLSPGTYVVTVTDANNCGPKTATFTITQPPPLVANLVSQTNVLCAGAATGAITVAVTGGTPNALPLDYSYSWTGPNGFTATTRDLSGIVAGVYSLQATDAQGCTVTLAVTLTENPQLQITYTTTPITCYGANDASFAVTISGGVGPYQYTWDNLSTALNQTNLAAGTYTITVTDAVGCIQITSIVIPEAPLFAVTPVVTPVSCYGANNGSIQLNFVGGIAPVSLIWSDGSTAGTTRNNLPPGVYTVTITDSKPCQIVRTFIITEPQPLVLSAQITDALNCTQPNSGAIDLIVNGGTPPYTYQWTNGATTEDLTLLTNGTYAVQVTDSRGCVQQAQYVILRPAPLAVTASIQTTFDCATHVVNQQYVALASGGVPPYTYQWSSGVISGSQGEVMTTQQEGLVTLSVVDGQGCTAQHSFTVDLTVLGYPDFSTTSTGYSTYGIFAVNDPITFTSSITGDYQNVVWDFGDGTFSNDLDPVHTYGSPGSYVVTQTVYYPFGCVYTQVITLWVEQGYFIVLPSAFTPNRDGVNDTYRPVTKRLKNVEMVIYDSWGSLIYAEKGDSLVGWDALIKNSPAENGNYYCKVTATTFTNEIIEATQTFVLIK
ncbi:PKD-like domain-containing protein [Flavobacterium stagni]|uniref:T9SS type B sorting domain-containing protein n=1 Tax=Flavobacterium stagni TaxID=2506421 RepID=A0A4Q1K6P1_9FLAO|nr:PKD domain-containing protein [Flavobacterium stagni]RXR21632.1 T9SS type B sorting domain-containing protein [Flavobacterium stagni]